MRIEYVLLARYAEVNQDGTVTMLGADADTYSAPAFPAVFPLAIVAKLSDLDPNFEFGKKLAFTCDIRNHMDKSILTIPLKTHLDPVTFPKTGRTARIVINFGGVVFSEPGEYLLLVSFGEKPNIIAKQVPIIVEASDAPNV